MYLFPCCVVIVWVQHSLHDDNITDRLLITKVKSLLCVFWRHMGEWRYTATHS